MGQCLILQSSGRRLMAKNLYRCAVNVASFQKCRHDLSYRLSFSLLNLVSRFWDGFAYRIPKRFSSFFTIRVCMYILDF